MCPVVRHLDEGSLNVLNKLFIKFGSCLKLTLLLGPVHKVFIFSINKWKTIDFVVHFIECANL